MKTEMNRYEVGQVYLLMDGTFVLISSVDPITKLNKDENSRRCDCKLGKKYVKNEQFKESGKYIIVVENEPTGSIISIDVSKNQSIPIATLRKMEANYIGKLTDDKMKSYGRVLNDYMNDQNW